MAETPRTAALIARAIVHLNFGEPDQATKVLFDALTECNFYDSTKKPVQKEVPSHGNFAA